MNVNFRQLKAFLAVADLGSFTKAAEAIGLSQSATSITVRELEVELGLRLLDRTTRQVRLTDAGEKLAATGARLIGELEACLLEIRDIGEQRRGRVLVACVPSIASSLMPEWLLAAQSRLPHVQVELRDDSAAEVCRRVGLGEIEFGVTGGPGEVPGLLCSQLMTDPIHLVCQRGHRLARKRVIDWAELNGEKMVMLGSTSGSHDLIHQHLLQLKVNVEVVLELAQPSSVLRMVESGMGISLMPRLAVSLEHRPSIVARPFAKPSLSRSIMAVRRADRSLSPAANAFWELIHELTREDRPIVGST
jgi:DNA-binding transcriptional LysR family regulator